MNAALILVRTMPHVMMVWMASHVLVLWVLMDQYVNLVSYTLLEISSTCSLQLGKTVIMGL